MKSYSDTQCSLVKARWVMARPVGTTTAAGARAGSAPGQAYRRSQAADQCTGCDCGQPSCGGGAESGRLIVC